MKSFLTSLLTLLTIVAAAALIVTFTGITPGFNDNVAKAQTAGAQPAASASPAAAATPSPTPTGNIIQTMTTSGQFTQALALIQAANLTQTLETGGPFTVFAPTDAAVSQVPPANLQTVLSTPGQLQQVLSYHVVPGELSVAQLQNMNEVTSLQGAPIKISKSNGQVMVNTATIVQPDIYATNGVIQAINQVLQLPAAGATATPSPAPSSAAPGATY